MGLDLDELREQRIDRAVFRHEQNVAFELVERPSWSAQLREEKILDVNEADGLIERSFAQRIARMPGRADDLEVLFDGLLRGEEHHVRARHHDLPCRTLGKLKNAFDDLAVLLRQDTR